MKAHNTAPEFFELWLLIDEYYLVRRGAFAAARMGLCARRTGRWRTGSRDAVASQGAGAGAILRLRAGTASRASLRHRAQRRRLFLGIAGSAGSRLGGRATRRT